MQKQIEVRLSHRVPALLSAAGARTNPPTSRLSGPDLGLRAALKIAGNCQAGMKTRGAIVAGDMYRVASGLLSRAEWQHNILPGSHHHN